MERLLTFEEEHDMFRDSFRSFVDKEMVPNIDAWERAGIMDRDVFRKAGASGFLGMAVPEEYGGGGVDDFRYNLIINEELMRAHVGAAGLGITLHNDVNLPYFLHLCNEEQKARWLPGIVSGELVTAIAMTEPGIGSDLAGMKTTAIRDGDEYVVNGSKTFITNGINADIVITAVKTDPSQRHAGMSLMILDAHAPGFERGRNLEKVGLHAQDTAELFFSDVRVPVADRLGEEGKGFKYLVTKLPQERLAIATAAVALAQSCLDSTLEYVKERTAFGQPIGSFQNSRFRLAELATEIEIGRSYLDRCVVALNAGTLDATEAAMAKWWCTEMLGRVTDTCVQLHGGYGYMTEYPVARAWADARITRIYGGTTEIMKEIIGKSMGL